MKKLLAALVLALALPGAASALTFSGTFGVSGDALHDPGLVVQTAPKNGNYAFDLDVGGSKSFKLFDIWTDENSVGDDDKVAKSLDVAFNLISPPGAGTLKGSVVGESIFYGLFQDGKISWNNPVQLGFGKGGILSVALSDATFNEGLFGLNEGYKHGAPIKATFTYVSPSAVPLPAGLGLIAAGMGAMGITARRRKPAIAA